MSGDISLTSGAFYGTQMKPDIFEPATAEWAGRAAMNAGWLFARQQQEVFAEGKHDAHSIEYSAAVTQQAFSRRFWLNEGCGTLVFRYNLTSNADLAVVSATCQVGDDGGFAVIGTSDGGSHTTVGSWGNLTIRFDPDWNKTELTDYGWLTVRCYSEGDTPRTVTFNYSALSAFPRT